MVEIEQWEKTGQCQVTWSSRTGSNYLLPAVVKADATMAGRHKKKQKKDKNPNEEFAMGAF